MDGDLAGGPAEASSASALHHLGGEGGRSGQAAHQSGDHEQAPLGRQPRPAARRRPRPRRSRTPASTSGSKGAEREKGKYRVQTDTEEPAEQRTQCTADTHSQNGPIHGRRLAKSECRQNRNERRRGCVRRHPGKQASSAPRGRLRSNAISERAILSLPRSCGDRWGRRVPPGRSCHLHGFVTPRASFVSPHAAWWLVVLTAFVNYAKRRHNVPSPARPAGLSNYCAYA